MKQSRSPSPPDARAVPAPRAEHHGGMVDPYTWAFPVSRIPPLPVAEPELGIDGEPAVEEAPTDGGTVLLMVTTTPKDAAVFVDDVRATKNPVTVPRSETAVRVRVEAPGYEPRVVEVQPKRSRQLEVKLDRRRR